MAQDASKDSGARKIFQGSGSYNPQIGKPISKTISIPYKSIRQTELSSEVIAALKEFLNSIVSTGLNRDRSVPIPEALKSLLYFGDEKIEARALKIETLPRSASVQTSGEKAKQASKLYLDDLARLIILIRNWLRASKKTNIDKRVLDKSVFENVEELQKSGPGSTSAFILAGKSKDLIVATEKILSSLGTSEDTSTNKEVGSLKILLEALRSTPDRIITADIWDNYILPLAKDFQKAKEETTFDSKLAELGDKKASIKEARLAFHLFLKNLEKVIKDTNRLPGKNRGKSPKLFLTNNEFEQLINISQANFYFPEDSADLTSTIADPDKFKPSDKSKITAFIDLLTKAMERILGREDLDAKIIAAQTAEDEADGGAEAETKDELEEQLPELLSAEEFVNKLLKNDVFISELRQRLVNLNYVLIASEEQESLNPFIDYVLKIDIGVSQVFSKLINQKLTNDEGQIASQLLKNQTTRIELIDSFIKFHSQTLGEVFKDIVALARDLASKQESKTLVEDEETFATASAPDNLDEIVQRYLEAQGKEKPTDEASLFKAWKNLSLPERKEALGLSSQNLKIYYATAFIIASQQLQNQGLTSDEARAFLYDPQNSNILNQFEAFVLGLDFNQLSQLNKGDTRLQLVARLNAFIAGQRPDLLALIQTSVESYLDLEETGIEGVSAEDLNELLSKHPIESLINLNKEELEKLGVSIADNQLDDFRKLLSDLDAARQLGKKTTTKVAPITPTPSDQISAEEVEKGELEPEQQVEETRQKIYNTWFGLSEETRRRALLNLGIEAGTDLGIPSGVDLFQLLNAIKATGSQEELLAIDQITTEPKLLAPTPVETQAEIPPPVTPLTKDQATSPSADLYKKKRYEDKEPSRTEKLKKAFTNPLAKAKKSWEDFKKLSLGAQAALAIKAFVGVILPGLISWVGLAGSAIGGAIGAVFGMPLVGASIGGWTGVGIDQFFGLHKHIGRPIDKILGSFEPGSTASAASNISLPQPTLSSSSSLAPTGVGVGTESASFFTTANGVGTITAGTMLAVTTISITTMHAAFLAPIPAVSESTGKVSKYVDVVKESNLGSGTGHKISFTDPNTPIEISYTVIITPIGNHSISISDISDTLKFTFNKDLMGDASIPNKVKSLDDTDSVFAELKNNLTIKPGEKITFEYSETYTQTEHDNARIKNSIEMTFTADDGSQDTVITHYDICTGECPAATGDDVADASWEIVSGLQRGWWGFFNYHTEYPQHFMENEYRITPDENGNSATNILPCPDANYEDDTCPDAEKSAQMGAPNIMFWCTWNVIYSFEAAGTPIPSHLTGVGGMRNWFIENGTHITDPNIDQIKRGDVAFFEKDTERGFDYSAHVAIVGVIDVAKNGDGTITTYDSNNIKEEMTYTVTDGVIEGKGRIRLNGVARLD
ncbi:MAG: hypothetical protein ABFQ62_01945 [Patescibacteria group bacterium]